MRECWAAIVLQRAKHRIGVDLIARTSQDTAAVVAAQIIAMGRDSTGQIKNIFAGRAGLEDGVSDLYAPVYVRDAASAKG